MKTKSRIDILRKNYGHSFPEKLLLKQQAMLRNLAFDNSLYANIITSASNGKIIIVNTAACKLFGYSKKELLTKKKADIFDINGSSFKNMLKQRMAGGESRSLVTALKKSGSSFPCEITSAVFAGDDKIKRDIITIVDMSQIILAQKNIDTKKEKIVAANIIHAKSKQKNIDTKKEKIVAANIILAKSKQKSIDIKKEKIVAANIVLVKTKQREIDTRKEKIVVANIALAKSKQKRIDTRKEKIIAVSISLARSRQKVIDAQKGKKVAVNITLAKSRQRKIDISRGKIIANNIALAQTKCDEARRTQNSDIGKELEDKVNQLLGNARLYLKMAEDEKGSRDVFLNHSSGYILKAIEEIGKISRRLTTGTVKNPGLRESIYKIIRGAIEIKSVEISGTLESFIEDSKNYKFKLNVFRIIQQEVNNIFKHGKATEISIFLYQNKKHIILLVSDNDAESLIAKKRKKSELEKIKSRAEFYNGTAHFVSQSGKGCTLTVTFPIENALLNNGFFLQLMDEKKNRLVEKVRNIIIELAHSDEQLNTNFSDYLSKRFQYGYNYLAKLFSEVEGITIEKFFILFKIERVKELILHYELNLTEIASKLHYSSVAHLSNQFKKITGLTPTLFRQVGLKRGMIRKNV